MGILIVTVFLVVFECQRHVHVLVVIFESQCLIKCIV